jgi:hypothetical protein
MNDKAENLRRYISQLELLLVQMRALLKKIEEEKSKPRH